MEPRGGMKSFSGFCSTFRAQSQGCGMGAVPGGHIPPLALIRAACWTERWVGHFLRASFFSRIKLEHSQRASGSHTWAPLSSWRYFYSCGRPGSSSTFPGSWAMGIQGHSLSAGCHSVWGHHPRTVLSSAEWPPRCSRKGSTSGGRWVLTAPAPGCIPWKIQNPNPRLCSSGESRCVQSPPIHRHLDPLLEGNWILKPPKDIVSMKDPPFHTTSDTYWRKSKQDYNPDHKMSPHQQTENNTKQRKRKKNNFFLPHIWKSRKKEKELISGCPRSPESWVRVWEHVMLLLSNVFFFLSFFSLQNELLSLLNIVKQEMGVHD